MLKLPRYYLRFENAQYEFTNPLAIVRATSPNQIPAALEQIQRHLRQGRWLAGYLSYELGYALQPRLFLAHRPSTPLLHLAVFDKPNALFNDTYNLNNESYHISKLHFNYSATAYRKKILEIKKYIRQGETYQLNFTGKFTFSFSGNPLSLYHNLHDQQPVPYAAFCKLGNEHIISLSPELFFEQRGNRIITKPMKGTSPRGYNVSTDQKMIQRLKTSRKQTAENVMIVDLLRNDLSKICRPGSVTVPKLFTVERYRTLLQLTSIVQGELKHTTSFLDIIHALFPGGSVTGAPKIRTMQLIQQLESESRGVYCGALGFVGPNEAQFNLPIRTIYLKNGQGELGIGSGITYDSDPSAEYQECLLKARFLTHRTKSFQLIETILWDKHYVLLPEHLHRLKQSVQYFDYSINLVAMKQRLQQLMDTFVSGKTYIVRVLVDRAGNITITSRDRSRPVPTGITSVGKVVFSTHHTDSKNIFLYHKTTHRQLYDKEYQHYTKQGYVDVLFCNEHNEVTEGTISNIIIMKNRRYYTPPVSCGLLAGIFRAHFIKTHKVIEKILTVEDVQNASEIYICNSVRGLMRVTLDMTK